MMRWTILRRAPASLACPMVLLTGRVLSFGYGSGVDDALNRIVSLTDDTVGPMAGYAYAGTSRRVSMNYGNGVTQDFAGSGGYAGLDRFGRVKDLHFKDSTGATIHQYQYTYDPAGNRLQAQVTVGARLNDLWQHDYVYDGLSRLIESHYFNDNGSPDFDIHRAWGLDILGNWSNLDQYENGAQDPGVTRQVTDSANRIREFVIGEGEDAVSQTFINDPNGNLVFDGQYVYFYDAWNRLVEVDGAGTLTAADFNDGQIDAGATGHAAGNLLLQNVYDGLGRLMETRRPLSQPSSPPRPLFRVEGYYYDGVRRIQTVVGEETAIGVLTWRTDREYIYGPDYVDEFVAQVADPAGTAQLMWMLQDANYNVMAILDNPTGSQAPTILAEYTYDPYGQPVYADESGLTPDTWNTVGHQGLFFCRLDFKTDSQGHVLSPLDPGTGGLYYNRGRWYSPSLGRFTSADPNETAMPLVTVLLMNARSASVSLNHFSPVQHFGDGMNLYTYLGANPLRGVDPLGLDVFADYDAAIVDIAIGNANTRALMKEVSHNVFRGLRLAGLYMMAAFAWDEFVWDRDEAILLDLMAGGFFANTCFAPSTPVWMADGSFKRIDEVQPGDRVMCDYNPADEDGAEICQVGGTFRRRSEDMLRLTISSGDRLVELLVTPEHPFYVPDQKKFVSAIDLQIGQRLSDEYACGDAFVVGIEQLPEGSDVVNLAIRGAHTYYVSGTAVEDQLSHAAPVRTAFLVHNVCKLADLKKIAQGHAWGDHLQNWVSLGIKTADELAAVLARMVQAAEEGSRTVMTKMLSDGRQAFWDQTNNLFLLLDPGNVDGGSAYLHTVNPREYWRGLK